MVTNPDLAELYLESISPQFNPAFVYDPNLNDKILGLYELGMSSTRVAVSLGITRLKFESLRSTIPEFNEICEFGESVAQAALERLALMGAQGLIKNFNNTILQFLLKSQYPESYSDKKDKVPDSSSLLEQLTAGSLKLVRSDE